MIADPMERYFAHDEVLDPPPYTLPPYSPPPYSPLLPYPHVQVGNECVLSVDEGIITSVGETVRIRPWEGNTSQKWKIESAHSRFGFRNQSSGKLLGVHYFNGNIVVSNRRLKHGELFRCICGRLYIQHTRSFHAD